MSPYNESVSIINTPFGNTTDEYWEHEDHESIPQYSVNNRLFLILAIVSMIVIVLSLFAIPNRSASPSIAGGEITYQEPIQNETKTAQSQLVTNVETTSGRGGISPIFTSEVLYWENKIIEWSNEHNLDPNIVATIMQIESCGDPEAVSVAGARGLFQVMPFHFSSNEDMLDPDINARRGLNFYNEQLRYTSNDKLLSFAGYNGGYAASGGTYENWPDETKRYYKWAKGIYEDAQSGAATSDTLEAWLAAGGAAGCQRAAARLNIS